MIRTAAPALLVLLPLIIGDAAANPSQLYGKSIVVSWNEHRVQRKVGAPQFNLRTITLAASYYISTRGRPFVRMSNGSDQRERVGASGSWNGAGVRTVQFQGTSLVDSMMFVGAARRIQVDFDDAFGSCTARVMTGKEVGLGNYKLRTLGDRWIEVQSVSIDAVACSVKDANIFAD